MFCKHILKIDTSRSEVLMFSPKLLLSVVPSSVCGHFVPLFHPGADPFSAPTAAGRAVVVSPGLVYGLVFLLSVSPSTPCSYFNRVIVSFLSSELYRNFSLHSNQNLYSARSTGSALSGPHSDLNTCSTCSFGSSHTGLHWSLAFTLPDRLSFPG